MLAQVQLNGRYEILRSMGEGGMTDTFLAIDRSNGRSHCVVKRLKPAATKDSTVRQTARRLFQQDVMILQQLHQHPCIPRLIDYFEQDDQFYIVQDYIEGHPLSSELQPDQPWSASRVIDLLSQLLPIVEFLHQNSVIHRDIKPDNIIRRWSDGALVLIDFGAVKEICLPPIQLGYLNQAIAIGTPGYMPIEQAAGKPRYSSDLYALGMVAIQALTGLCPSQLHEDRTGEIIWTPFAQGNDKLIQFISQLVRHYFNDRPQTAIEAHQQFRSLFAQSLTSAAAKASDQRPVIENAPTYSPPLRPVSNSVSLTADLDSQNPYHRPCQTKSAIASRASDSLAYPKRVQWIATTVAAAFAVFGLSGWLAYQYWNYPTQSQPINSAKMMG